MLLKSSEGIFKAVCPQCDGFIDGHFNTECIGDAQLQ
jgi:hypothetical protein